jgi:hypothetical protein
MGKQEDTMAILKLYELRRDKQMRKARQWYFSEFAPQSAMDIVALYRGGERASANFRMVASYWDTACSLVLNDGIDRDCFSARTPSMFSSMQRSPTIFPRFVKFFVSRFSTHLEELVKSLPDFEAKMESRKRLIGIWSDVE